MENQKKYLPKIGESFIKAYVEANGEIDEVMVEYDKLKAHDSKGNPIIVYDLQTRDDNTVIIHKVKSDKQYTREEVAKLCRTAWIKGGQDMANSTFTGPDKWIEENLK